jgi:hypothetical protein
MVQQLVNLFWVPGAETHGRSRCGSKTADSGSSAIRCLASRPGSCLYGGSISRKSSAGAGSNSIGAARVFSTRFFYRNRSVHGEHRTVFARHSARGPCRLPGGQTLDYSSRIGYCSVMQLTHFLAQLLGLYVLLSPRRCSHGNGRW